MSTFEHPSPTHFKNTYIIPTVILFLAFLLRVHHLDTQPLTGDEAFSIVSWTRAPLHYLLTTLATIDPQPPAALLTFYGWIRLVGDSEFAARMLSVLSSTATVAIAYAISHRLANRAAALVAMFLCAINPFQLWHSQDLRTYSLWMVLSALSAYTLLSVADAPSKRSKWVSYTLAAITSIYTFYLEAFVLIAQNTYVAYRAHKYPLLLKPWLICQAVILIAIAPWLLQPEIRNSSYQPTAAMPDIANAIQSLTLGNTLPSLPSTIPANLINYWQIIALGMVLASLILAWATRPRKTSLFLTAYIAIPPALLAMLTIITQKGYFRPRYLGASSLVIIVAIALLIEGIRSTRYLTQRTRTIFATTIAILMLSINLLGLYHYYYDPAFAKAPNWRDTVQILYTQTAPTDILIFNYPDPALTYYFKGPAETIVLPTTSNPPQENADSLVETLASQHSYLWFIPVHIQSWDGQQTIAKALNTQTQLISDQWIGQTRLYQYASWKIRPDQIATPTRIIFSGLATLEGYRTTPNKPSWLPNTTTHIEIFWRPQQQYKNNLTIFFHLLGPTQTNGSPLWAQDDYPPQDGHTSTTTWKPGTLIRDTYTITIPADALPGTYTITIGFYDPITNTRYPFGNTIPQAEPDSATLLTFTIQ